MNTKIDPLDIVRDHVIEVIDLGLGPMQAKILRGKVRSSVSPEDFAGALRTLKQEGLLDWDSAEPYPNAMLHFGEDRDKWRENPSDEF